MQKSYQYNGDGSLRFMDDALDGRFDRLDTYDFAGRLVAAKSGTEADGVSTEPYPNLNLPYRQSYQFNAFGKMTQRNNLHWGLNADPETALSFNLNYTYQNNRITNTGFQYDADGRLLQTSTPETGSTMTYDARGLFRSQVGGEIDLNVSRDQDGNGLELKRIANNYVSSGNQETKTYYIRSSVLGGGVVSEHSKVYVTSAKVRYKSYVHAGGAVIAWRLHSFTPTTGDTMRFEHRDASGLSYRTTIANGYALTGWRVEGTPAEMDPMGGNVGVNNPYPDSPPDIPEPVAHNIFSDSTMFINGQRVSCIIDGIESPCSLAQSMLANGSGIEVTAVSGYHTVRDRTTGAVITSGAFIVNAGYGVGMLPVSMMGNMGIYTGSFNVNAAAGAAAGWSNVINAHLNPSLPRTSLVATALGSSYTEVPGNNSGGGDFCVNGVCPSELNVYAEPSTFVEAVVNYNDDGTALPCPKPDTRMPALSAGGALAHYMSYRGTPKTIPIKQVDATPPQPFDFPAVLGAYNSGAGRYTFDNVHSNAVQTGIRSAEVLGRITFTLSGTLWVDPSGQYAFAGDVGVLSEQYDFDASNRDPISEISTFIGNQIPGRPFTIHIAGRYKVDYSSNSDGSISRTCTR